MFIINLRITSAACHQLLLQARTKTNVQNFFGRWNCNYQIIVHENKNASPSPAIVANRCYKLFINFLESFYVIKFSSQFSTNHLVSIFESFYTNSFHAIQIFRELSTKDKRSIFCSIFHERFSAIQFRRFNSTQDFPQQILVWVNFT